MIGRPQQTRTRLGAKWQISRLSSGLLARSLAGQSASRQGRPETFVPRTVSFVCAAAERTGGRKGGASGQWLALMLAQPTRRLSLGINLNKWTISCAFCAPPTCQDRSQVAAHLHWALGSLFYGTAR